MTVTKTIKGQEHDLMLLEVLERDVIGRPLVVKIHADDHAQIPIHHRQAFVTAFVNRDGMKPKVKEGKA
jgi:hypothetical protein